MRVSFRFRFRYCLGRSLKVPDPLAGSRLPGHGRILLLLLIIIIIIMQIMMIIIVTISLKLLSLLLLLVVVIDFEYSAH